MGGLRYIQSLLDLNEVGFRGFMRIDSILSSVWLLRKCGKGKNVNFFSLRFFTICDPTRQDSTELRAIQLFG